MAQATGFEVLEARRFMFSPIGFPAEKTIERFLETLGLGLIMANQLVVARRCRICPAQTGVSAPPHPDC